MKHLRILLLVLIATQFAFGQKRKAYNIKINWLTVEPFDIKERDFHIVNVKDETGIENAVYGKVMRGGPKRKIDVGFEQGLSRTVNNYMTFIKMTRPLSDTSVATTLVIKRLSVQEKYERRLQVGTMILQLEFYNPNGKMLYASVVKKQSLGSEVTVKHQKLLQMCLRESITLYRYVKKDQTFQYNLSEMKIIKESPQKGIYGSFLELVCNKPMFDYEFEILRYDEEQSGSEDGFPKFVINEDSLSGLNHALRSAFYGFCDGENIYIRERADGYDFGYVEFLPKHRYALFVGHERVYNVDAIVIGGALGGLVGGVIAGAATYQPKQHVFLLDIATSEEFLWSEFNLEKLMKNYPDFYAEFDKAYDSNTQTKEYWLEQYNLYLEKN